MRDFCESLEKRTLFSSGVEGVTLAYDAVVADAGAIKAEYTTTALNLKDDAKLIAGNIKTLGKSKTNSADIAALNKAIATADAVDLKITNELVSTGKAALTRAKSDFAAEVNHPSAARALKLSSALSTLTTVLGPYESTLAADIAAGNAKISAALDTLASVNPSDSVLADDADAAENYASGALSSLSSVLTTTNTDIDALAAAVS